MHLDTTYSHLVTSIVACTNAYLHNFLIRKLSTLMSNCEMHLPMPWPDDASFIAKTVAAEGQTSGPR